MSSKLGSENCGRGGGVQGSLSGTVPGCFSPRLAQSQNVGAESIFLSRETPPKGAANLSTGRHLTSSSSKECAEMFRITRSKSQTLDCSPSLQTRINSGGGVSPSGVLFSAVSRGKLVRRRERILRRSSPLETLFEHQRFRCTSSLKAVGGTGSSPHDERARGTAASMRTGSSCSPTNRGTFFLRGSYVSGKPWMSVADSHGDTCRDSSRNVSSLAVSSSGEYVALGDRSGRVFLMRRIGLDEKGCQTEPKSEPLERFDVSRPHRPYAFAVGRQAYTSIIDPLNNVEVTPNVQAICFLPQVGASTHLLTANEKLPKLYKVVRIRESPTSFSALECLGGGQASSLTLNPPHGTMVNAMKQVSRYALNHEYNINSLCSQTDGTQFFSADDLTVKLWCVEYPEASVETYSVRPPCDEETREMICSVQNFPHEPFLLFVVNVSGTIHVMDTRQTIKWVHKSPLTFRSTVCENGMTYSSMLLDCALSPCGRHVAGRDTTGVCLWDVRRPTVCSGGSLGAFASRRLAHSQEHGVVQRWEVHPRLRRELDQLFQSGGIERFRLRFLSSRDICTGGFSNTLHLIDILGTESGVVSKGMSAPRCGSVRALKIPRLQGAADRGCGPLQVLHTDSVSFPAPNEGEGLLSTAITNLSSPLTSLEGDCSLMASCGSAVFQVAYSNLRL